MDEDLIFSYSDDDSQVREQFEKLISVRGKRKKQPYLGL